MKRTHHLFEVGEVSPTTRHDQACVQQFAVQFPSVVKGVIGSMSPFSNGM